MMIEDYTIILHFRCINGVNQVVPMRGKMAPPTRISLLCGSVREQPINLKQFRLSNQDWIAASIGIIAGLIFGREDAKAVEFCAFQVKAKSAWLLRTIQAAVPPANGVAYAVAADMRAGFRREFGLGASVGGQHLDGKAAPACVNVHLKPAVGQLQGYGFHHAVIRVERDKAVQPPTGSSRWTSLCPSTVCRASACCRCSTSGS